ncbi:hypothetical protein AVEN_250027-1 [Araneus ventricosus]|uniref:Uncharacterized protein n=1 Tax=Araneus ventricosus TaxID=182803 RepID=A0A4Y2K1J8_ARAVE|nr:hypothetical protein AVEN_250027-1 [Araneus ventricosus]
MHKILRVPVSSTLGIRVEHRYYLRSVYLQDDVLVERTDENRLGLSLVAIQERLDQLQITETIFKVLIEGKESSEARNEAKCLPLGAECSFTSGPRCCSVRTRCVIWDRQGSDNHGNAKWTSHCREYNFGKGMDAIDKFFKNLG